MGVGLGEIPGTPLYPGESQGKSAGTQWRGGEGRDCGAWC